MTDPLLITPPLALIDQWWDEAKQNAKYDEPIGPLVATQAAQWGANQELEACCEWLTGQSLHLDGSYLRAAMRPKSPSLKGKARQIIDCLIEGDCLNDDDAVTLRRVLEALPND